MAKNVNKQPDRGELDRLMEFATVISKSSLIPKAFQGRPSDILVAIQMGREVGLSPIASCQTIAVINGKPSVYGDGLVALCRKSPEFEDIKESIKGEGDDMTAICEIKRKGQSWATFTFSMADAKRARLTNKPGPWQDYTSRMLKMRARGFALRDTFADMLGGLITTEEAKDYPVNITPTEAMNQLAAENFWELRKLKGDSIDCKDAQGFAKKLRELMSEIKNSDDFNEGQRVNFLKNLFDINDHALQKLNTEHNSAFTIVSQDQRRYIESLGGSV